jgi:tetratricopeptide (TPR) repeat protein
MKRGSVRALATALLQLVVAAICVCWPCSAASEDRSGVPAKPAPELQSKPTTPENPFTIPDTDVEMFPWQFQMEADRRYTAYIESKIQHLHERLEKQPDDPTLLVKLGRLHYYLIVNRRVELVPQTIAIFEKVLAAKPDDAVALAYHGALLMWSDYLALGWQKGRTPQLDQGMRELEQAIARQPDDIEVRTLRAFQLIYGQDSPSERWLAAADLKRAIELLGEKAGPEAAVDLQLVLGDVYFSLGRVREARTEWQGVADAIKDPSKRTAAEVRLRYRQGLGSAQRLDWRVLLAMIALLLGIASLVVVATQPMRMRSRSRMLAAGVALVVAAAGVGLVVRLLRHLMQAGDAPLSLNVGLALAAALGIAAAGVALLRLTREPLADAILMRGLVAAFFAIGTVALFQYVLAPVSGEMLSTGAGALFTVLVSAVWTALALSFPIIQRGVSRFVDRRLFHREESTRFLARLGTRLASITSEPELLELVEGELRGYLRVRDVRCIVLEKTPPPEGPTSAGEPASAAADQVTPARMLAAEEVAARDDLLELSRRGTEPLIRTAARDPLLLHTERRWGHIERVLFLRPSDGPPVAVLVGAGRAVLSGEEEVLVLAARQLESTLENLRLHADVRRRAVAEEALGRLATQAELRALRAQIHPHFLFNTLNSIAGLVRIDPHRAEQLVEELAELLRYRFRAGREFIPLSEELALVDSYLKIEQVRLGARMRVERDVAPEALAVPVPPLLLQPLVENAVTHGLARKVEGGCVRVTARVVGERLELRVEDDGAGMTALDTAASGDDSRPSYGADGVGLKNVLERLRRIYNGDAAAEVQSAIGRGTTVVLELPVVPPAMTAPARAAGGAA